MESLLEDLNARIKELKVLSLIRSEADNTEQATMKLAEVASMLQNVEMKFCEVKSYVQEEKKKFEDWIPLLGKQAEYVQSVESNLPLRLPGASYTSRPVESRTSRVPMAPVASSSSASSSTSSASTSTSGELSVEQQENATGNVAACGGGEPSAKPQKGRQRGGEVAQMEYLTADEMESVPGYMRGRATQDRVNALVDLFNEFLRMKYHILSQPIRRLSKAAMQRYKAFKDAELKDTRGSFFFTDEDVKTMEGFKLDGTGKQIFQILRHVGRIKEVRGNSLVRYTLV